MREKRRGVGGCPEQSCCYKIMRSNGWRMKMKMESGWWMTGRHAAQPLTPLSVTHTDTHWHTHIDSSYSCSCLAWMSILLQHELFPCSIHLHSEQCLPAHTHAGVTLVWSNTLWLLQGTWIFKKLRFNISSWSTLSVKKPLGWRSDYTGKWSKSPGCVSASGPLM